MSALRFVSLVALAIWLGGMIAIGGVAAPAAFAVLDASRAATLVGEILRRFHLVSYGAAAIVLVSFTVMALVGPRPRRLHGMSTLLMLAATIGGVVLVYWEARDPR